MYFKSMFFLACYLAFFLSKAHSAAWSEDVNVEKIYLSAQNTVVVKVTGNTNINDCALIEGYQYIFKNSGYSKMLELFQTALVNDLKVKIYSKECQLSSWANVSNTVTFNQVNHLILSK